MLLFILRLVVQFWLLKQVCAEKSTVEFESELNASCGLANESRTRTELEVRTSFKFGTCRKLLELECAGLLLTISCLFLLLVSRLLVKVASELSKSEVCLLLRLYKCRKCRRVRSSEDRSGLLRGSRKTSSKLGGGSRVEGSNCVLGEDTGGVLKMFSGSFWNVSGVSNVSICRAFFP